MAKWGEGDPRWIVEERPDATNVNNWHWTEKNATPWSKDRLRDLLVGVEVTGGSGDTAHSSRITKLTRVDGEATANNRKAKLIFLFEWELKAEWEGTDRDGNDRTGDIEIPNLSDENDADEVAVNVSCKENDDGSRELKRLWETTGTKLIQERLDSYIRGLKEEFSKGLVLPTKKETKAKSPNSNVDAQAAAKAKQDIVKATEGLNMSSGGGGCPISTTSLKLKDSFKCPARDLFAVFTTPEMMTAFSRVPAQSDPVKGGKFSMFGGMVEGSFEALEQGKEIQMKWRMKNYPSGHYSSVTLSFDELSDATELRLEQTGIPSDNFENTQDGWRRHYFENIKRTFGYSAALF